MILLNFSHPISSTQQAQIEALTGRAIERTIAAMPQFDEGEPFVPQVHALLKQVSLTPAEWQTEPILVVLPSLNFIAAIILAEFHGRAGYFPTIVRLRPIRDSMLTHYEVAEVINLQQIREMARTQRA
jgi:hypothetical protein